VTTALQAIAHRARDRHAARIIEAEFAQIAQQQQQVSESEPAAAAALDQLRDTVFAQLRSQLAAAAAAAPTPTPQFVAGLVRALERERAAHAKLTRRVAVLERERDEAARRAAEHEATIEALRRPRIPLFRSTSSVSTSSESHSDRVGSSSNRSSVSPPTSVFDALRKTTTMGTTTTTAMTTASASTSTLPISIPIRSSSLAPGRPLGNHNSNKSNGNCNMNDNIKSNGHNGGTNVVSHEYGYLSFTIPKTTSGTSGTSGAGSSIDLAGRL
jgi:hypothetical protein